MNWRLTKENLRHLRAFAGVVRVHRLALAGIFVLIAVNSVLECFGIGLLMPLLMQLSDGGEKTNAVIRIVERVMAWCGLSTTLWTILIVYFLMVTVKGAFKVLEAYAYSTVRMKMMNDITHGIFATLMSVAYEYFHTQKKGDILYTVTGTSGAVGGIILCGDAALVAMLSVAGYMLLLFLINWQIALTGLLGMLVFLPLYKGLLRKSRAVSQKLTDANRAFNSHLVEIIDGIKIIKTYAREQFAAQRFNSSWHVYVWNIMKTHVISAVLAALQDCLTVLIFVVIVVASIKVYGLVFAELAIVLFLLYKAVPRINEVVSNANEVMKYLPQVSIALRAMERKGKPFLPAGTQVYDGLQRAICLNHVSFAYAAERPVLLDICLNIPRNTTAAIVGATGSGKTTLINLLLRLYLPTGGSLCYDDVDVRDIEPVSLLRHVGFVPQDVFLFDDTIANNIRFGRLEATDEEVRAAARIANADGFISRLPQGYETWIGERGVKLSGGQQQMVALARALVRRPEILVLDEATSSLDNESERLIQEAIERLSGSLTIVAIAHRLSTIRNADQIIVLSGGRVAECGDHDELLAREGVYARYYHLQFKQSAPS